MFERINIRRKRRGRTPFPIPLKEIQTEGENKKLEPKFKKILRDREPSHNDQLKQSKYEAKTPEIQRSGSQKGPQSCKIPKQGLELSVKLRALLIPCKDKQPKN